VGQGEVHISHLQFVDDTVIMCEANLGYMNNVNKLL